MTHTQMVTTWTQRLMVEGGVSVRGAQRFIFARMPKGRVLHLFEVRNDDGPMTTLCQPHTVNAFWAGTLLSDKVAPRCARCFSNSSVEGLEFVTLESACREAAVVLAREVVAAVEPLIEVGSHAASLYTDINREIVGAPREHMADQAFSRAYTGISALDTAYRALGYFHMSQSDTSDAAHVLAAIHELRDAVRSKLAKEIRATALQVVDNADAELNGAKAQEYANAILVGQTEDGYYAVTRFVIVYPEFTPNIAEGALRDALIALRNSYWLGGLLPLTRALVSVRGALARVRGHITKAAPSAIYDWPKGVLTRDCGHNVTYANCSACNGFTPVALPCVLCNVVKVGDYTVQHGVCNKTVS